MKLNTQQIATIEHYLLDWNLEYKDFYDEVLDHFLEGIERKMDNGESFEMAFKAIQKDFSGKRYKSHLGLKAFEKEYASTIQKEFKREIRGLMLLQFTSWRALVWLPLLFMGMKFWLTGEELYKNILLGICLLVLILPFFFIPKENFKGRLSGEFVTSHWPLEKRKRKPLFKKSRQRLMWQSVTGGLGLFYFLLNGGNMIRIIANWNENPKWLEGLMLVFFIAFISLMWAFLELCMKEREAGFKRSLE